MSQINLEFTFLIGAFLGLADCGVMRERWAVELVADCAADSAQVLFVNLLVLLVPALLE